MKGLSLLFLRATTGLLLIVWAMVRIGGTERAIAISERYYYGLTSSEAIQYVLGGLQLALGVAVLLGLFRRVVYPVQAVVLGLGGLAVWKSIVDPLGFLFGPGNVNILFFPSITIFAATLVLLAFRDEDTISLDAMRRRQRGASSAGSSAHSATSGPDGI